MSIQDKNYLYELIQKLQSGNISKKEVEYLSNFFGSQQTNKEWPVDIELKKEVKEKIFRKIQAKVNEDSEERVKVKQLNKRRVFKYAVSVLLIISIGVTWFFDNKDPQLENHIVIDDIIKNNIIKAGTDKAILTLEDGLDVILEKGESYSTNNITSTGDKLIYKKSTTTKAKIIYNYLTIPRGGQFFLQLSDGTNVWLNSESKLKYPVYFLEGEKREVELVYGEAYFEVSPSTNHNGALFNVKSKIQELEVLGTKFNIKAYKDEDFIYTTLVEGKVNVNNGLTSVFLKPNEQSRITEVNDNIIIEDVDVYNATSWINGVFSFESKSLKDIMKVLSRWYDMDVVFLNKELENIKFVGILSKNQKIEDILSIIKDLEFINSYKIINKELYLE